MSDVRASPPPFEIPIRDRILGAIERFLAHPATGVTIISLIVISVGLLVAEVTFAWTDRERETIDELGHVITLIFVAELALRYLVARSVRRFVGEYWIDILAVLPVFRVFRIFRALRILRILRLFRVGALLSQHLGVFSGLLARRSIDALILATFILFAVIFGTIGMRTFEGQTAPFHSSSDAFWWAIYSLASGQYSTELPATFAGRLIGIIVIFLGMGVFAMVAGTVSAVMVEKFRRMEGREMETADLANHLVVCGWNRVGPTMLDVFLKDKAASHTPVVILSEHESLLEYVAAHAKAHRIYPVRADFARIDHLRQAGIEKARYAVILADRTGNRFESDTDARTVLTALTIERLNPRAKTVAELIDPDHAAHLKMGGVDEILIAGDLQGQVLASSVLHHGLTPFLSALFSSEDRVRFAKVPVPAAAVGKSFESHFAEIHAADGAILLGILDPAGAFRLNPKDHVLEATDTLLVLERGEGRS